LERGRRRVWRGLGQGGEEEKIAVAHLYLAKTRASTNVHTFVSGGVLARYKCDGLTFVLVGATNWYKCEAFVLGGWEMTPTRPCERAFVPVGTSNWYKFRYLYRGIKYLVQIKKRP
jgi:hypothetical protein